MMAEERGLGADILQEADRLLLAHYIPASVVIDANQEIVQVRGQTSPYLELAAGRPTLNLFKMARPGLSRGLRAALHAARKERRPVIREGLRVLAFGTTRLVRLTAIPLKGPPADYYCLVLFEEQESLPDARAAAPTADEPASRSDKRELRQRRITELEQELSTLQTEMQDMLEEHDTANEVSQTANEELLASNEELRCLNEELETSKEDLQILNEELSTANQELATRNEQLKAAQEYTEAVEKRLAFLQYVLDALPNSVSLVQGEDARLVLANRAAATLWGAQWRIGQPMLDFLESNQIRIFDTQGEVLPPAAFATLRALSEGKTVLHYQEAIHRADGMTLPVLVNAVAIESQDLLAGLEATVGTGQADAASPAALVVHQDVTSLKEAEELKDRFLGLVAHELRTPLAAVKGFASMLLMQTERGNGPQLAEWQHEAIAEIDLGADRLTRLTNDLLDAVRLQAGRLLLHRVPLNLVELTQRVIAALQRTTDLHQLTLRMDPASLSELLVQVDGNRIEQVLSNLLANAIKYSPQGGKIEVTLCEQMERQAVLISIRDQGIGIPQAEQALLFGRFARASNGEALLISGTGLGLYLCRELVLQHEGQIWFESREGKGATFFVRLPLMSDHSASDVAEHASALDRQVSKTGGDEVFDYRLDR